jgi:flagella basal body P-ring formation protein FlgA
MNVKLKDTGEKKFQGRFNLPAAVTVDGKDCGTVILSGWVDRFEPVVCAGRALPRHTEVTADDLKLSVVNISRAPHNIVTTLDGAVGKRVRNSVRAGAYLRDNMLETPPVILKGDRVKLEATSGALTVRALGKALGDAGVGEQIKVENISSKKRITGRVKDAATVLVRF